MHPMRVANCCCRCIAAGRDGRHQSLTMTLRVIEQVFLLLTTALWLAALGFSPAGAADRSSKSFDQVYVIVLENHGFDDALYNGPSPFLRGLSQTQGLAVYYLGVTHPSLPNYLAMISGDEFGVRDDDPSCFASDLRPRQACHRLAGDSIVDQLEAAGLPWALYADSLPAAAAHRKPRRALAPMRSMRKSIALSSISSRSPKIRRDSPSSNRSTPWRQILLARRPISRSSRRTNAMTAMA
jgi:hypothetical protein